MLIYQNSSRQFVADVRTNVIADIMATAFVGRWGREPGLQEFQSWQNSLSKMRDVIELAGIEDTYVALEYEVPYNQSRIDCLVFGRSAERTDNVALVELKQWSRVEALPDEGNFVETYVGGSEKVVPHPSQQVKGYHGYLIGFISDFEGQGALRLFSCAYCHNYDKIKGQGLFAPIYSDLIREFPVYSRTDTREIAGKLKDLLEAGEGFEIFNRFMQSPVRPSLKLLENVGRLIKGEGVFSLLNEQLVAKNLIWARVRRAQRKGTKSIVIVHGGPGTGKSLIAVNVLAEAAEKGQRVFYACKSKPFTEGLRKKVGREPAMFFSNLYRFVPSKVKENEIELLLVDEAHRIEKKSNHQYTPAADRTDMPQVEQLIRAAKTCVFFIDDKQNVRSQEIGNSDLIRAAARDHDCEISEVTLENQFRCMGSNDYLLWLESVLGYSPEERILNANEIFDFRIFDDPKTLYEELGIKERQKPNSARLTAGFCWPWSRSLAEDGSLVKDVKIGAFEMPWETHGDITRPPQGYVKWYEWAYRPEGFKQVGCIYTAQGFEFDYVGVIIGNDLVFDKDEDRLRGEINATRDPTLKRNAANFETHVRNIYRTLLTRGMRGCYVYFTQKQTEAFFRSRIDPSKLAEPIREPLSPERPGLAVVRSPYEGLPVRLLCDSEVKPYENAVPVFDLEIAAGAFSEEQWLSPNDWVELPEPFAAKKGFFVARVVGESMNRRIPNGSWCLFRSGPAGSRHGKVVLVQLRDIQDPETGRFTVKVYGSEKRITGDSWKHLRVTLSPDSTFNSFSPLVFEHDATKEFSILGEVVAVLGQKV